MFIGKNSFSGIKIFSPKKSQLSLQERNKLFGREKKLFLGKSSFVWKIFHFFARSPFFARCPFLEDTKILCQTKHHFLRRKSLLEQKNLLLKRRKSMSSNKKNPSLGEKIHVMSPTTVSRSHATKSNWKKTLVSYVQHNLPGIDVARITALIHWIAHLTHTQHQAHCSQPALKMSKRGTEIRIDRTKHNCFSRRTNNNYCTSDRNAC